MSQYQETFADFMQERGLHITRQRMAVADLFAGAPGHYSMEEIHDALKEKEPGIGQATVYRTVKLLLEAGLVRELYFGDGISRYEVAGPQGAHNHLVCRNCGEVVEIDSPALETAQERSAREHVSRNPTKKWKLKEFIA